MQPLEECTMPLLGYNYCVDIGYAIHPGVDFGTPGTTDRGKPIRSIKRGNVEFIQGEDLKNSNGYGRFVVVKHVDGTYSLSAHMTAYTEGLQVGDRVKAGQTIGYVGGSGTSEYTYSDHLHLEVFGENVAQLKRDYKIPWGFYPTKTRLKSMGVTDYKQWVRDNYYNPWNHLEAQPVSEWAETAYEYLTKNEITDGTRPRDNLTREEAWVMLWRLDRVQKQYINKIFQELREWK